MLPVHIIKIPTFKSPAAPTQYFFGWLGNFQNFRPKNSMPDCDVFKWRSSWTGLIVCNHTIFQWLIPIWSWDANNKYCQILLFQLRRKAKRGPLARLREWGEGGNALTVFCIAQDARRWSKYHGINVERRDQRP